MRHAGKEKGQALSGHLRTRTVSPRGDTNKALDHEVSGSELENLFINPRFKRGA